MLDISKISPLGLGLVKIGRNTQVKYPQDFDLPSDKQVIELLNTAQELGVNLLDTAPAYGTSEERLGNIFKSGKIPSRHNWLICSKAGEIFTNGRSSYNFTKEYIVASVKNSLQQLNTDYIDILLIHSDGNDLEIIEKHDVFATLSLLKQQGLIRAYGMSTKTIAGGKLTLDHADFAMVTYNLQYQAELEVIQYAANLNKGIFIKKGLMSGHLNNSGNSVEKSMELIFNQAGVTSLIVGTINPKHLRHNIDCIPTF